MKTPVFTWKAQKKKLELTCVFLIVQAEMLRERIRIAVPAALARTLRPRERFRTSDYRRKVCLLCIRTSFRIACDIFNELTLRKDKNQEIPINTFIEDFYQEGQRVRKAKQSLAVSILVEHGFNPQTLEYSGEWPKEWEVPKDIHITITGGNDSLPVRPAYDDTKGIEIPVPDPVEIQKDVNDEATERENLKIAYSEPDTDEFVPVRKRRTTRYEVKEEDIEWVCNGYVNWLNEHVTQESCMIRYAWDIEKSSTNIVYIAIDAVYVVEQSEKHVKGGKPEMKTQKTRISHWNVCIEFDNLRYYITAHTRFESLQQTYAFLLRNELMDRYFVFFADGETEIFADVKTYFGNRPITLILDWIHIVEKVFQRCSSSIYKIRKTDPRSPKEEYKQKSKLEEGKEKPRKETALSVLYARRITAILWVGNVSEAISYIQNINPEFVRDWGPLNELIGYLRKKESWIVCYALRKRAGLRNSSNGSEGGNNTMVALRQKDDDKSWREEGSTSASNMSCIFLNHEEHLWFEDEEVTFLVPKDIREKAKQAQKKQVHGSKDNIE